MSEDDEMAIYLLATAAVLIHKKCSTAKKRKYTPKRSWVRPMLQRRQEQGHNNLLQEMRLYDEAIFFSYTRMSVQAFDKLLNIVGSALTKHSRRQSIPAGCRLALTLRFLATGDSYESIGYAFRVAVPTVCNIVREVCAQLWNALQPKYLRCLTSEDYKLIANRFTEQWGMPNCCGAIDGKHIIIHAPSSSNTTNSTVLLAICDADYNFTMIDIDAYDLKSDGGVLMKSSFGKKLFDNTLDLPKNAPFPEGAISKPYFFVGDEAFPGRPNLLRPYSKLRQRDLTEEERIFNYRLSRVRRIIENTFGVMVARFRIFHRAIIGKPETVIGIVKACVCLHNYIRGEKYDVYCDANYVDREQENGQIIPGGWRADIDGVKMAVLSDNLPARLGSRNATKPAVAFRDSVKDYVNAEGAYMIPWQIEYVRQIH